MARRKLLALQVLRAFAALAVAVHHVQNDAAGLAGGSFHRSQALPWLAGVDVFFVVSGFIMVHASRDLFGQPGARQTFLSRRIARIVPLYWAATSLFLISAVALPRAINSPTPHWAEIAASYLFVPWTRPDGNVQPVYSLGWTLNYEMLFYVIFALAIVRPRAQATGLVALLIGLLVAVGQVLAPLPQPFGFWSAPIMLEFVFGLGLGLLAARGFAFALWARVALAVLALALLHMDLAAQASFLPLPEVLAYGLPAAMLVAAAALGRETPHPPAFERALVVVGDASYALYLVHPFVMRALTEVYRRFGLVAVTGPWAYISLALAGAVVAALFVHRWFERPATRVLRRALGA